MSKVWWIKREGPGRLGIMACPDSKSLQEDLAAAKASGVDEVISLLTADDVESKSLDGEGDACKALGLRFKRYGITDHGVPVVDRGFDDFLSGTAKDLHRGRSIAIHCNGSRGRSGLIAGALLIMEGMDSEEAMRAMRAARHAKMPETDEQVEWLNQFAQQFRPLARTEPNTEGRNRLAAALVIGVAGILAVSSIVGWSIRHRRR